MKRRKTYPHIAAKKNNGGCFYMFLWLIVLNILMDLIFKLFALIGGEPLMCLCVLPVILYIYVIFNMSKTPFVDSHEDESPTNDAFY